MNTKEGDIETSLVAEKQFSLQLRSLNLQLCCICLQAIALSDSSVLA